MTFSMPFTENETKHLIYLLNCEYRENRLLRETIVKKMMINVYSGDKFGSIKQELDHLKDELIANQLLVHKLDDHLTDLIRGHQLQSLEELEEPNFLGPEANRHLKLLTTKPQNETD